MPECCGCRFLLIGVCVIQLLAVIEFQVFEFLGFLWAPIIGNFLHFVFIVVGLIGACRRQRGTLIFFAIWCLIWIGCNAFIICFYLEVGILSRDADILSIGTTNKSWWYDHGFGCRIVNDTSPLSADNSTTTTQSGILPRVLSGLVRHIPSDVEGCLLKYYYVEVIHSGLQCLLALLGFCITCVVIHNITEEEDSSQPVHDELEYIKMRYRSPARQSYRNNKAYQNLNASTASDTNTVTLDVNYRLVTSSQPSEDNMHGVESEEEITTERLLGLTRLPSGDGGSSTGMGHEGTLDVKQTNPSSMHA